MNNLRDELLKLDLGPTNRPYNQVFDFIQEDRLKILTPLIIAMNKRDPECKLDPNYVLLRDAINEIFKKYLFT